MHLDEKHAPIQEVLDQIIATAKPDFVFMYNCKYELTGDLRSFKLCVVCDFEDKRSLLRDIFDVDCDIPFDILLYTREQFRQLRDDTAAFANRVCTKGKMLYGKE